MLTVLEIAILGRQEQIVRERGSTDKSVARDVVFDPSQDMSIVPAVAISDGALDYCSIPQTVAGQLKCIQHRRL